jgi:hypothetical protein
MYVSLFKVELNLSTPVIRLAFYVPVLVPE